jgi:hypothetical protein
MSEPLRVRTEIVALALLLLAVTSLCPQRARAQESEPIAATAAGGERTEGPPADEARRAEARAAFLAGEAAFAQDDYVLALDHFRRAFALAPHDAVRFNVAVCLERLGRFREATVEYDAASESTVLDDAGRARATGLAERTRARLGALRIESSEPAEIDVDGVSCLAPCRLELDPGHYTASARGAVETRFEVDIVRGAEARHDLDGTQAADHEPGDPPSRGWTSFGALLGAGLGIAALGGAGMIGFGTAAQGAHDRFTGGMASEPLAQEGELYRDLANVSIAVLAAGAVLAVIDLILLAADPPRRGERAESRALLELR